MSDERLEELYLEWVMSDEWLEELYPEVSQAWTSNALQCWLSIAESYNYKACEAVCSGLEGHAGVLLCLNGDFSWGKFSNHLLNYWKIFTISCLLSLAEITKNGPNIIWISSVWPELMNEGYMRKHPGYNMTSNITMRQIVDFRICLNVLKEKNDLDPLHSSGPGNSPRTGWEVCFTQVISPT